MRRAYTDARKLTSGTPVLSRAARPSLANQLRHSQHRYRFTAVFASIYIMPKRSPTSLELPPQVSSHLRELGANLAIARKRRKESIKAWAGRIGVSEPTLARMEQGDPGVAFGTYATALWLMGRAQAIPELAAPQLDMGALENEVRAARARAVRAPVSLQARLKAGAEASLPAEPGHSGTAP